jgi:hypothetical protein
VSDLRWKFCENEFWIDEMVLIGCGECLRLRRGSGVSFQAEQLLICGFDV